MEIEYVKSAAKLLNRDWINYGGLDLSKEVLWVSVGQKKAELQAVKVGGQNKFYSLVRFEPALPTPGQAAEFFLTSNFDSS